jgi:hypothetical protein
VEQRVLGTLVSIFMSIFMLHILTARHQGIPIVGSDVLAQETEAAQKPPSPCVRSIDVRKDR